MLLESVVDNAAAKMVGRAVDVSFWARIFEVILELMADCQERNSSAEIEDLVRQPNRVVMATARWRLRRRLGRRRYKAGGRAAVDALFASAQETEPGTIAKIVENPTA